MNRLLWAAAIAATTTAVSWAVARWLERHRARPARAPHEPIERWENEGGALAPPRVPAPHGTALATSQVPR